MQSTLFFRPVFCFCIAYADDLVLLAPTARAMRILLDVCDKFASDFSVVFNSSKSKCLVILPKSAKRSGLYDYPVFIIGGNVIEYVDEYPHLGHLIN